MKIIFFLVLFFHFSTIINLQSQTIIDLRKPLNPENFKVWDEYIRSYAPSDSAFNVVNHIARQHLLRARYIVALEVYLIYETLFPNKKDVIESTKKELINYSLTQIPTTETYPLYEKLARILHNSTDGIVCIKRIAYDYIKKQQFDSAAIIFKNYKKFYPDFQNYFDEVIDILTRDEVVPQINHFPSPINTNYDEWDPNPTPNGKYLFMSARRPKGFGGIDIFHSENTNGNWSDPQPLKPPINGSKDETIDNVSVDGNILLLSGNYPGSFGKFDIYISTNSDTGWTAPRQLTIPVNSGHQDESGYITSDGRAIIFTSDRPGGIGPFVPYGQVYNGSQNGNMDIYISFITPNGWSQPINLGPTINTPFSERSAFLHQDGKTLYFSSEGHPGLGGLDVFKSVRLSDTSWTEWSKPVNLGRYINTVDDDWGYKIGVTGDSAFFSSRNRTPGLGGFDIYSLTLPQEYRPQKVAIIKGKIIDKHNQPLFAQIKWQDLTTGDILGNLSSNPQTGDYFIALPLGKFYGYFAEKDGYYPISGNVDLRDYKNDTTIIKDIVLISQKAIEDEKEAITINNIFFDYDKYELRPESFYELDRFLQFYSIMGKKEIIIEGHTDNIGSDKYNRELSENRARSVRDYFISKGIDKKLITTVAYGSSRPIAPNDTETNRQKNRRVEIRIK